jgi:hypothetical protein
MRHFYYMNMPNGRVIITICIGQNLRTRCKSSLAHIFENAKHTAVSELHIRRMGSTNSWGTLKSISGSTAPTTLFELHVETSLYSDGVLVYTSAR